MVAYFSFSSRFSLSPSIGPIRFQLDFFTHSFILSFFERTNERTSDGTDEMKSLLEIYLHHHRHHHHHFGALPSLPLVPISWKNICIFGWNFLLVGIFGRRSLSTPSPAQLGPGFWFQFWIEKKFFLFPLFSAPSNHRTISLAARSKQRKSQPPLI